MRRRALAVIGLLATLALAPGSAGAATPTVTTFSSGITNPAVLLGITAAADGKVWFVDNYNNQLGAVTLSSGTSNELPSGNYPVGVTSGPNGKLYFFRGTPSVALSYAAVMNPATGNFGQTWYGGGNNALPRYGATGPDGNIWITESGGATDDKIGLIDATGNPDAGSPTGPTIHNEIPLVAGSDQNPEVITAGPGVSSGTPTPMLWFTEFTTGRIGRLQPISVGGPGPNGTDGALLDEYLLPTGGAGPEGITAGPDGNIWFTEFNTGKVGRLIPPTSSAQGAQPVAIDEFDLGANSQPVGIAAGADGNLWVALTGTSGNGSVVRMNTSGQITGTFPTPSFQEPYMITPAADGNLWFTSYGGARVGRITTALDPPEFSNTAQITVPNGAPQSGPANPYPSNINVSNLEGAVSKVTVRLTGISHTFPDDLDILLVGPQGQNVMLASDVGSPAGTTSYPANGITLNFDESAARSLPDNDPLVSGFYKPTNRAPSESQTELITPAPPSPYGTSLGAFNGSDPNGTWKLFVIDDATHAQNNSNIGKIFGGWGLDIQTSTALFVGKSGAGSGTVTSVPAGIDCGAVCTTSFATGSPVVLTASPSTGSRFALWQGCDSVSDSQCTVSMDTAIKNVTASFELTGNTPTGPTGQRAAALANCKKKKSKRARKKCKAAANKLPV